MTIEYTNAPPVDAIGFNYPLMRCPSRGQLVAIVTSPDLLGCKTHFWGGRTVPCESLECKACHDAVPWRWHSYLSAFLPSKGLHFIFESTARATENFIAYRKANNGLRGCLFQATRATERSNSRVLIVTKTADLTSIQLPEAPEIRSVLATIWNMKLKDVTPIGHVRGCDGVSANTVLDAKKPTSRNGKDVGTLRTQLTKAFDR